MSRPEHLMPPQSFYNEREAVKYTNSTRIIEIQAQMASRCLELLDLPEGPAICLDLGCGSGLSGEILSENGHLWWGLDIYEDMLDVALSRDTDGELLQNDLGQGFNFVPGFFDAAISVSAIQWLCNADKKCHDPWKRLLCFFQSLKKALTSEGKAVLQFYPEDQIQLEMICNSAMNAGFAGGLYIDYPNSGTAKKHYLVLFNEREGRLGIEVREGLTDEEGVNMIVNKANPKKKISKHKGKKDLFSTKSKYWIFKKKEKQRQAGLKVRKDTKYTGRKRKKYF